MIAQANTGAQDRGDATSETHVEVRDIRKHFGGVQALRGVSLRISRGSIHGLVGENGAGKSTLGKIITGVARPDSGELVVDGRPVRYRSPHEALADGLTLIAQELVLVPQRTVIDNVLLGVESQRLGFVNRVALRRRYAELDALGFSLPPNARVSRLRLADQQKVEILRAVARQARLIVMDEPTAALAAGEVAKLLEIARGLAAQGTTIVFVSHALDQVLDICDTVTVLRDGQVVGGGPAAEESAESLVTAMIGRSLDVAFPSIPRPRPAAPTVLSVRDVSSPGMLRDVSLDVKAGEIHGLAGLVGSGRSELARAIFGADRCRGTIEVAGREVSLRSPSDAIRAGIAMLPERRKEQGLIMGRSTAGNVVLPHLSQVGARGLISRRREGEAARQAVERTGVRGGSLGTPIGNLSGGNQQKAMFAKWLIGKPRVLIADEPTRGVDVAAKRAIYELIGSLTEEGMGVLLISSELEEVLGLAHRVTVMRSGAIAARFAAGEATEAAVLRAAFGTNGNKNPEEAQ